MKTTLFTLFISAVALATASVATASVATAASSRPAGIDPATVVAITAECSAVFPLDQVMFSACVKAEIDREKAGLRVPDRDSKGTQQ